MTASSSTVKRAEEALPEASRERPAHRGGPTDPSHDEHLRKGIIFTDVSRGVAAAMVAVFLACIYVVPLGQFVLERKNDEESALVGLVREFPTKESLARVEEEIAQTSYAKSYVQPRMQLLLSSVAREGNRKAVIGRDGYLFYKPGISFVASPGFLNPHIMELRESAARDAGDSPVTADPRPAILAFHSWLRKRGITLVLFPVPDKVMLQPRELHGRLDSGAPAPVARSRDWAPLVAELQRHGVLVFDPTPTHVSAEDAPRFLVQDTHWNPEWMQRVASDLAGFVNRHVTLSQAGATEFVRKPTKVSRVGDIVDMLKLPEDQQHFLPQEVTIAQVTDKAGNPFEPSADAEVLLLGDSFTNVFTEEFMGWGTAAGFGPQLAAELRRPIDVIAQNDSGAFATRAALELELEQGNARLDGKKVVIWEFAARELAVGNWKPIDWEKLAKDREAQ